MWKVFNIPLAWSSHMDTSPKTTKFNSDHAEMTQALADGYEIKMSHVYVSATEANLYVYMVKPSGVMVGDDSLAL